MGLVMAQIASMLTEYGRIMLLTIPSQGIYGGQWTGSILVEISKMLPKICYHGVVSFRTSEILNPNKPIMTPAGNFSKQRNNNPQIRAFPVRNIARNSEIRRESAMICCWKSNMLRAPYTGFYEKDMKGTTFFQILARQQITIKRSPILFQLHDFKNTSQNRIQKY